VDARRSRRIPARPIRRRDRPYPRSGRTGVYRLWFDLAEIGEYLGLFHEAHEQTADSEMAWANLHKHLQPAQRWPQLVGRRA